MANAYTSRNFYEDVKAGNITDAVVKYATDALEKMDARNAKRAGSQSASQKANEVVKTSILTYMAETGQELYTAKDIATALEMSSTQKATGLLALMVKDGSLTVRDYTPTGKKKDLVKGYSIA